MVSDQFVLPSDPKGITLATIGSERLPNELDVAARIQADPTRVVRVYAPVSGRLISVAVRPADLVTRGQPLALIASSDVAAARQAYQQATADNTVKKEALVRSKLLLDHHAIAEKDYEQAQADYLTSQAALESARERLLFLNVGTDGGSDQLVVKSPRSGVVMSLGAAAGEFSKSLDSADPLCTIADLSTVWAVGNVYEKDIAAVRVGEQADVAVDAYPGQHWRGRIGAIAGAIDPATRTLGIRVVLANPGLRLKPGMFAAIRLVRSVRRAVVIPSQAVLREGNANYVFLEQSPGRFIRRAVTLGQALNGGRVEVTSGLSPGHTIVVQGAELLRVNAAAS
jgi:cobalt-zinc-cadmium efflux system membrane fusion protein